ncbi:MAG: hypothetical protein ABL930_08725 [Pseudobdellovibrio sp.]
MLKAYKKTSKISVLWVNFLLLNSFFALTACSYFQEEVAIVKEPTEREKLFYSAEKFYLLNNDEAAKPIYFKITRNTEGSFDPIYDKSLWRLIKIYEKADEAEKALLTLDELDKKGTSSIPKIKIQFSQIKNHFVVTNSYQAERIRKDIDKQYRDRIISLYELYDGLIDSTELAFGRHVLEELKFLGEVQKFFVFVMESNMTPENERLTERLIQNYEKFFAALNNSQASPQFKKELSISLLDQLRKFDQYKIDDTNYNPKTMLRFTKYSEKQQKKITESLSK